MASKPSPGEPALPRRPRRRAALAAAVAGGLVLALVIALTALRPAARAAGPLPLGFWYWTSRWAPSPEARRALAAGSQVPLFVKAATFTVAASGATDASGATGATDATGATNATVVQEATAFPSDERPPTGTAVHLVYSFAPAFLAALGDLDPAAIAHAVATRYAADRAALAQAGWAVGGLQLDLDAPTRLLPRYAALLAELRPRLPAADRLSITSLVTWIGTRAFRDVAARVDFHCPMPFGDRIPQRIEDTRSISPLALVDVAIARSEALGRPYFLGLPAYGYGLVFDPEGRLASVEGRLALDAVAREEGIALVEAAGRGAGDNGDVQPLFEVLRPTLVEGIGLRPGWRIRFDTWTASGIAARLRHVAETAGPACRGVLVFRLPTARDPLVVGPETVRAAAAGRLPPARARLVLRRADARSVAVEVANEGPIPTAVAAAAVQVDLTWGGLGLAAFGRGGFDGVETRAANEPASRLRADALRLEKRFLDAGAHVHSARLAFAVPGAPAWVEARGRVTWPDGRAEELAPVALDLSAAAVPATAPSELELPEALR